MNKKRILSLFVVLTMVMSVFGAFTITTEAASMSESTFFAKLNYSAYPGLSAVKSAVDKGDYATAKSELLKYFKNRHNEGTITGFGISEADENYGMAVLPMRNILTGPYEFDMWEGEFTVTSSDYAEYSVDVTDRIASELNNQAVSFMLFAGDKQQYPVYVKSKEAGEDAAPKLRITFEIDGVTKTITVTADNDTYISSGNTGSTYGGEETLVIKEDGSGSNSTGTDTRRAYINFPLTEAANSTIISAELIVNAAYAPDCTTGDKDVLVINIGDTVWSENEIKWGIKYWDSSRNSNVWTGICGNIYSYQDADVPTWNASVSTADSEYHNVTSRFWFGRPMAYEYLSYLEDPEGYNESHPYSDVYPGEEFGPKLVELMSAFAKQMNYGYTRTLETGERLNRWVDIVDAFLGTDVFDNYIDEFYNIITFMWGDCNYLNGLSITDGSVWWSNWRIVANAGFFKATEFFPEFNDYASFRSKVEYNVEYTMNLLYNDDMSFTEAGPAYAQWCVQLFGDCAIMADKCGNPMSSTFITKLRYAARNALNSFYPDGYDSNVGDSNYRDKMPEFKRLAEFLNDPVLTAYVNGDGNYTENLTEFYDSVNSAYMRTSWDPDETTYVSFVNNPSDGHYHPDSNQVLMYAYGQPLLVDSGRYGYSSTNSIYNELRYASAHNTVEAVGVSMGTHANSAEKFSVWADNGEFSFGTSAQHGYSGVTHTRNVLFLKGLGFSVVTDYVTGSKSNTYRQNWHFMPSSNAVQDGNTITTDFYQKANIIVANADADASAAIRDGYFSADYGLVAASKYASFEKIGSEVKFGTVLYPVKSGETAEVAATELNTADNSSSAIQFSIDGSEAYLYVRNTEAATGEFGNYATDAKMAYVTDSSVALVNGTTVTGANIEIESPVGLEDISVSLENGVLAISGDNLMANTDSERAIAIKAAGVNTVTLNGEEIGFANDNGVIYAVSIASETTITEVASVEADKDGFVASSYGNEGATNPEIIQAQSSWQNRNAYAAFDLTDYADADFDKAVLRMTVTEAASGGKIDFYWLDYGTWTRDTLEFILDSSKMPTHTANTGTYTGYSYRFDGDVSGLGVGSVFEVDFTKQLKEYLANGGEPKFTLAMLSETGSTKFASINNSTYAGPTIVLTNEETIGVTADTKAVVSFVNENGEEIAEKVTVDDVTENQLYVYDAPKFITGKDGVYYALDSQKSNIGVMITEGDNLLTLVYTPAAEIAIEYTCGEDIVATKTDYAAPGETYVYTAEQIFRTEDAFYLVDTENSVLSVKAAGGAENKIVVALAEATLVSDNLVENGDFEEGLDGWYSVGASNLVQNLGGVERSSAQAYSGEYSVFQATGGSGTSGNNLYGQFSLGSGVEAGKKYILMFRRYGGGASSITLTLGLSDEYYALGEKVPTNGFVDESCGGLGNSGTSAVSCNLTGLPANEWHQLVYILTASEASKYASFYARWSEGQYFDDFELYEIESDYFAVDVTVNYVDAYGNSVAAAKTVQVKAGDEFDGAEYALPTMWKSSGVICEFDEEATGNTVITVQKGGENTVNLIYTDKEYDGIVLELTFDDMENGFAGGLGKANVSGKVTLEEGVFGNAVRLNGTNYLNAVMREGGSLLTGMDEITIVYYNKVDNTNTNWPFYAAANGNAFSSEADKHYLGALEKSNSLTIERYNDSSRPANVSAATDTEWKQVAAVVRKDKTELYIDGVKQGEQASSYLLTDILGTSSVFQIGKANWGSGEYYSGLIDEFRIYDRALTAEEIAALRPNEEFSFTFDGATAEVKNAEGGYAVVVAQYDKYGNLLDVKSAENASVTVAKAENTAYAKAFAWDGFDTMRPLANAITVTYSEE